MSIPVADAVNYAFSTIHIIDPVIFKMINKAGPFSITDAYLEIAALHKIAGYVHNQSRWVEFGRIENLDNPDYLEIVRVIYNKYHSV